MIRILLKIGSFALILSLLIQVHELFALDDKTNGESFAVKKIIDEVGSSKNTMKGTSNILGFCNGHCNGKPRPIPVVNGGNSHSGIAKEKAGEQNLSRPVKVDYDNRDVQLFNQYSKLLEKRGLVNPWLSKGLKLPTLPIELPSEMPSLPSELPSLPIALPSEMPSLPSELPSLPIELPSEMPSLPSELPSLPISVDLPKLPTNLPKFDDIPGIPSVEFPNLPEIPNLDLPDVSNVPKIDLPNLSEILKNYLYDKKTLNSFPYSTQSLLQLIKKFTLDFSKGSLSSFPEKPVQNILKRSDVSFLNHDPFQPLFGIKQFTKFSSPTKHNVQKTKRALLNSYNSSIGVINEFKSPLHVGLMKDNLVNSDILTATNLLEKKIKTQEAARRNSERRYSNCGDKEVIVKEIKKVTIQESESKESSEESIISKILPKSWKTGISLAPSLKKPDSLNEGEQPQSRSRFDGECVDKVIYEDVTEIVLSQSEEESPRKRFRHERNHRAGFPIRRKSFLSNIVSKPKILKKDFVKTSNEYPETNETPRNKRSVGKIQTKVENVNYNKINLKDYQVEQNVLLSLKPKVRSVDSSVVNETEGGVIFKGYEENVTMMSYDSSEGIKKTSLDKKHTVFLDKSQYNSVDNGLEDKVERKKRHFSKNDDKEIKKSLNQRVDDEEQLNKFIPLMITDSYHSINSLLNHQIQTKKSFKTNPEVNLNKLDSDWNRFKNMNRFFDKFKEINQEMEIEENRHIFMNVGIISNEMKEKVGDRNKRKVSNNESVEMEKDEDNTGKVNTKEEKSPDVEGSRSENGVDDDCEEEPCANTVKTPVTTYPSVTTSSASTTTQSTTSEFSEEETTESDYDVEDEPCPTDIFGVAFSKVRCVFNAITSKIIGIELGPNCC